MSRKPKVLNAFVHTIEYIEANADEVIIELSGVRKAPKGSGETVGKGQVRMRLVLSSYQIRQLTQAGRRGLESLAEDAESKVRYLRSEIEKLGKAA